jgi:iron complex outermembrane receptor protein
VTRLLLTASSLALLAAGSVSAQDATGQTNQRTDSAAAVDSGDVVVTAQRRNQSQVVREGSLGALGDKSAADVPFSVKSYNAALILNQQPQTLGQVLENDPSIRTTYGFGNAAEQFVVRGFPLYGDDIGFDGLYGITPRQLVAPELYEQVQVLNGASAFLNGAAPGGSAIGGNVNLVPKRAGTADLFRATTNYTSSGHVGGSFDVAHRFGDGAFGVRLNGVYRAGDVAIDDEFRRATVLGAAFDYRAGAVRLSADIAYQRYRVDHLRPKVTIASATVPRVPQADRNYGQAFGYTNLRDIFGSVRGEWDIASNAMLYAQFGARDGSERGIYDTITVSDAVTGAATGNGLFVPRTDNNEAAQAGLRVRLGSAVTQEINVGGTYVWQVNRNGYDFRYGPDFAGYATNLYTMPQVALPSSTLIGGALDHPFPISRTRLGSVFASDTVGLFGDRVLLTGGLRLQQIAISGYAYNADATNGIRAGQRTSFYSQDAVTPVAGIVVKPIRGLSLFANRIESLAQGPTAPASALDPASGTTKPVINLGEVFAPYRSVQYEIGGKLFVGRVVASIALFSTSQPVGFVAADAANPAYVRYSLDGEQRNRGIELSLDGELAKGLRLIAGGSVIDAKLRRQTGGANQGNTAPGVPDYTANANVEWDLPFVRGLTVTGRLVQTGKQEVNAANTLHLPAWTRVDLGARYVAAVADRPVTFRVSVDNVADNRYWASAYDTFSQALLQGMPRTYKASVSIDF